MVFRPSAAVFWLAILAELAAVTFLTVWPIRDDAKHARHLRDWLDLYSVDSNLDVWLLSVLHCLLLPLCFLRVAGQTRRHRKRYASARLAVSFIIYTCQVCGGRCASGLHIVASFRRVLAPVRASQR
jgi:hypothetical protein